MDCRYVNIRGITDRPSQLVRSTISALHRYIPDTKKSIPRRDCAPWRRGASRHLRSDLFRIWAITTHISEHSTTPLNKSAVQRPRPRSPERAQLISVCAREDDTMRYAVPHSNPRHRRPTARHFLWHRLWIGWNSRSTARRPWGVSAVQRHALCRCSLIPTRQRPRCWRCAARRGRAPTLLRALERLDDLLSCLRSSLHFL